MTKYLQQYYFFSFISTTRLTSQSAASGWSCYLSGQYPIVCGHVRLLSRQLFWRASWTRRLSKQAGCCVFLQLDRPTRR